MKTQQSKSGTSADGTRCGIWQSTLKFKFRGKVKQKLNLIFDTMELDHHQTRKTTDASDRVDPKANDCGVNFSDGANLDTKIKQVCVCESASVCKNVCERVRLCARMCVSEIESVLLYERMGVCNDGRNVRMSVCRIQSTCQEAKPQDCIVFFTRWLIPNAKQGLLLDFVALRSKCAWTRT